MSSSIILPQDSSEPLYRQVRQAFEDAIAAGQYLDRPLPSSRALAVELGISRNTINLAFQGMIADGLIVSEERVGYRANTSMLQPAPSLPTPVDHRSSEVNWSQWLQPRVHNTLPEIRKDYDWHAYPYPFIYGQVPSSAFPITAWNRALRTSMEYPHVNMSLRDSGSADDPLLIEQLRTTVLPSRGIRAEPEEVLITLGAQNGLFLCARSLVQAGDKTVIESPGYPDAAHILAAAGADLHAVEVDEEGIDVDQIPTDAGLISVTPSHQFPTNAQLSQSRRRRLLDHARFHNSLIIEDDYDSELRYVGRAAPALRASDRDRVIYIGSFSKFLAPGLRIGYVVAAPELIERMRHERRYSVRHPPGQIQRALALLIASGDYQRVLRRYRLSLKDRWSVMNDTLRIIIGSKFQASTGGTSMWVPLPDGVKADCVVRQAAKRGVLVESGTPCFIEGHPDRQRFLRIGYAAIPLESIVPGLRELAEVIHAERQHHRN